MSRLITWWKDPPTITTPIVIMATTVFFTVISNVLFFSQTLMQRNWTDASTWLLAGCLFLLVLGINTLLLCVLLWDWTVRWLAPLLFLLTAFAMYFMNRFHVYLDPSMMRNVFATDWKETRDLLNWNLGIHVLLLAIIPTILLWRLHIQNLHWARAMLHKFALIFLAIVLCLGAVMAMFQDFASLMRNNRELRYLITPANYIFSSAAAVADQLRIVKRERILVGTDARINPQARAKPFLFVIVVGETARAANWGLNNTGGLSGYARQTTPQLAALDVLNFRNVTSCGTNTETSLPCMFSAIGRRDYDQTRINNSESLLHVLNYAQVNVLWRDNQSGCKGVCKDLPTEQLDRANNPALCKDDQCFDEILIDDLENLVASPVRNRVLALHMIGNHGPAYFKRYPDAFAKFQPACQTAELNKCKREQIVNSYDNALLYTDYVLAKTIEKLKRVNDRYDTALLYVSDHGESLGESGIYLHGLPYAIAPQEQKKVPMVMWLSPEFESQLKLDRGCMQAVAKNTSGMLSHDSLFHTVLGMLQIQTSVYEQKLDLSAGCRKG